MVAGLLFLAFAFFAVGQASATRNGAQGAADAAALAAAQRARVVLGQQLMPPPGGLGDVFKNEAVFRDAAYAEGVSFAAKNRSDVTSWRTEAGDRRYAFTFWVKTRYTVGSSVIPGTEQDHGTAHATAVIELRCDLPPDGGSGGGPTTAPTGSPTPSPSPVTITCDGKDLPMNPMPDLEKIFTVKLVD
ncbi:pilus assembly protein TadG-related protein [Streptomyces sp. NPDC056670]|uniref:pilus assembly protein TadG-related protein n=1 Tax=Streptomyces sp. NPDC056670 TaxID=3345904 RepID=UPI003675D955